MNVATGVADLAREEGILFHDRSANAGASGVRHLVLVWLCVATTIAYIDRGCLSVAEKLIRADLGMTESQMGLVMSAFFLAYALFQMPAAGLDQTWGSRRALPVFAAAWSLATGLCGATHGVALLLVARFSMGAAEAGIFPSSTGILSRWYPVSRRAWVSGVLTSFMGVGGGIGAALTGFVLVYVSWRWMFLLYALPGLIWALGFALWFRNTPREHPSVNPAELAFISEGEKLSHQQRLDPIAWRTLLTNRAVLGLVLQQFFRAAAAIFYLSWFPTYLHETRGVGVWEAGLLTSLPHWTTMLGCLAGGWFSDRVLARTGSLRLARQGVSVASMLLATLLIGLAYPIADARLAVLVLSIGAFSAALAGPCAYALTMDLGGRNTPQVFGIMNTSGAIGSILFPIIVPKLVVITGSWDAVLTFFAAIHIVAGACWLIFDADRDTI
ncbi:MFS transporter [Singulisphaera acidiphila]|uniref:Sugar phosphate permease n=1 Tax=Singulisphaera acidiphila (strain ATCC BAA-1392 / DSM 18658 / VKM B-2454 / MOB10) TaxID=886293 RepID=L0DCR7_SINAD|nr:MFS transporter [Singulisphaera acidiphila]AGA27037.1 sugar phosphate permease [Singulisphaera acidiphila DSM 18658]